MSRRSPFASIPSMRRLPALLLVVLAALLILMPVPAAQAQAAPSVTGVVVSSDAGDDDTYALGEIIRVTLTFSEAVDVTGSPQLKIDMDPADWGEKWAGYESGDGTGSLTFAHTVVEPNYSTEGIAVLENTLELNGGSIKSAASQADADLSHAGRNHNSDHKVDWQQTPPAPAVSGVAITSRPRSGDTYGTGEIIRVALTFTQAVYLAGSARLKIDMDPADWGEKWAPYESGSRSARLTFAREVAEPNYSSQGIAVLENSLAMTGGVMKAMISRMDADLSHAGLDHDADHKVDWQQSPPTPTPEPTPAPTPSPAPSVTDVTVSSAPASNDTYALGETITITVTFSEAVDVTGTPQLKIDMDPADWGTKVVDYQSGSDTASLTFTHTVVEPNLSTQGIAVLENSLELNGGTIRSAASQTDAELTHVGRAHDPSHKVDWQRTRPNRAPVVNTDAENYANITGDINAPSEVLVSKPFYQVFTDPDGDELTYAVSVTSGNGHLVAELDIGLDYRTPENSHRPPEIFHRVWFKAADDAGWKAITPTLADPASVTVRLTATDPGGLSVSVDGDFLVHWESHPEVVSATATGTAIELTFDIAVEDDPAPDSGQFTVNVFSGDGTTGTVSVSQVSVSGNVVTLGLASELAEGQAVTVDYANDYDTPLQRAGGGDPAPDIDGLAVAPPGPAANFAVLAETGDLDLSVTWDVVGGATYYKLDWRQSNKEFEADNAMTVSDTNATITVSDYGQWEVQLQACNDAGCGLPITQQVEVDSGQLRVALTASPANPVVPKSVVVEPVIFNAPSGADPSYKWEIAVERGGGWRWRGFNTGFVELRIVDYNGGTHGSKAYRVTVSYDTGDSATSDPLIVTWARSQPNRAPVVNELAGNFGDFVGKRTAPRGSPVSKSFEGIFSDPDGDELTYAVSVSDDRSELVAMLGAYETTHRVGIEIDANDNWKAVSPALPDPLTITVTLTATDTDGLSASVSGDFFTDWESHPALVSATASNQAITLTFDQTVQADPAPGPGQFTVNVVNEDGSKGTIAVSSVSANGAVATLELGAALISGQRITLDYAHDDDAPWKRAADGGDSAPGFTGQAVRFPLAATSSSQVCYRTTQVRDAIMKLIPDASDCVEVTDAQLAAITGDLRLNGRGIQMVRVGDFDGLSNLNTLDLQYNALTSLPQGVFDDLTGLRRLRVNNNRLTELSPDLFASLTGLEHLDLGRNNLITVPANLLANNPNLVSISLHDNGLTEVPAGLFDRLTNLKTLDLSWNRLATLPAGLFADFTGLSTLWLDDAVNPRLCERPQDQRDSILEELPEISDCRLVTDGDVTLALAAIPSPPLCERTPQVRDAILNMIPDVSNCADVTDVHLAAITGTLSLADQEVSTLRIGDFDGLSSLDALDLEHNTLTSLPKGSFRDLSMLRWLRLNNNHLAFLDKDTFSRMDSLHEISLNNNRLTRIPAGAFDGLSALRTLHLQENELIPPSVSAAAENRNPLPAGLFADLTNIETLTRDRAVDPLLCEQSWDAQDAYLDGLPDINNCRLVTWEDISLAARRYIEEEYILPYQEDYPWLHEAWFDVPVKVRVGHYPGYAAWFWYGSVGFTFGYEQDRHAVYHELTHHYTMDASIHADDPTAKLSILSLWLYQTDHKKRFGRPGHVGESIAGALPGWAIKGETSEYLHEDIYAVIESASSQKIPQWFFDTYTSDGSLETVNMDQLWGDFRYIQRNITYINWNLVQHLRTIFGGFCSDGEGSWALNNNSASNPWVDGGCVNYRPGQLTATAGGTGELSVSWNAPLRSSSPSINAYVVQWKSGDQEYDTSRQAIVTTLSNLAHTITGLTSGAEYTVRVAAVNRSDITDFDDDLGHSRTAETTANAG